MTDTATTQFDLPEDNLQEEIFDYVSSLFGIHDTLVLDKSLNPVLRLEELTNIEKKVLDILHEDLKENQNIYIEAINKSKKSYLIRILRDLIGVSNYSFPLTNENITSFTQKHLGKIQDLKERYLQCADLVFKRLLFEQTKVLNNNELERFIEQGLPNNEFSLIINQAKQEADGLCNNAYEKEISKINKIKRGHKEKRFKKIASITGLVLIVFFLVLVLKYGTYYFFDIESIYKNKFYKSAKISMEAIPYQSKLIDSLNSTINETNQKLRLDYINNSNSRYFKIFTLFLAPDISGQTINNIFSTLPLPEELRDPHSINKIRETTSHLISKREWERQYKPSFGANTLEQFRAYGAISNFLIPSLSHHIIKDLNGLPVKKNGVIQVYAPPTETEVLKKDLLNRFHDLPEKSAYEPKVYIDKYDEDYKAIKNGMVKLLETVKTKKTELINTYRSNITKEEKETLKITLQAIALLESRLDDLNKKIQARYDYITKYNTYRLPY